MSFTVVVCDEGHRIHAARRLGGQTLPCPKCGTPVTVPEAKVDRLSDTAVLRILTDSEAADSSNPRTSRVASANGNSTVSGSNNASSSTCVAEATDSDDTSTRACPKCTVQIGLYLSVCPFCHCYAGPVSDYWNKMLGDASPTNRQSA